MYCISTRSFMVSVILWQAAKNAFDSLWFFWNYHLLLVLHNKHSETFDTYKISTSATLPFFKEQDLSAFCNLIRIDLALSWWFYDAYFRHMSQDPHSCRDPHTGFLLWLTDVKFSSQHRGELIKRIWAATFFCPRHSAKGHYQDDREQTRKRTLHSNGFRRL